MHTLGQWSTRHRRLVVLLWLALIVLLGGVDRAWGSAFKNDFNLPATDSTKALDLLRSEFPAASGESASIVWQARTGTVTDAAVEGRIQPMLAQVSRLPHVSAVASPYAQAGARQVSADGTIAFATVTFDAPGPDLATSTIQRVIDTAEAADGGAVRVELGGQVIQQAQQPAGNASELIGIAAAAVILFLAFGSLLAMLLPLATAVVALIGGLSAVGLFTHVFSVAEFAPSLATLIGLGVGIDYALFIVSRHRANLRRGMDVEASVGLAIATAGRAVLFAGVTVCIALLGLFLLGVSFFYGVAVAAAMVVLFTMFAALTLLPALLGFLGPKVLSRRVRRRLAAAGAGSDELSTRWWQWGSFVQRHPTALATAAGVAVLVLAIPFASVRLGSSDQGNNPTDTTTRQAYDLLAKGFGPGFNGPFTLAAAIDGPAQLPVVQRVADAVAQTPGVAKVGPAVPAPSGHAAIVTVYPTTSPQAAETTDLLHHLRDDVIPAVTAGSDVHVYVGGITPIFADFSTVLTHKLPLFVGIVVLLAFVLLMLVFRSLLIPLTASVMNLLAAGAAFGVVVAVFQWGWLGGVVGIGATGPIESFLPVMMFAILFGLSMDYEVFLVSRMHEDWLASGDNDDAVTRGQAETGGVITAAASIMIVVFASFVLGGERVIKEFGVGLAGAVLIDALIVRTVLVPALMHVFGKANWWLPGWLDRVLPRLSVEGPPEEPAAEHTPEPARV